VRPGRAGLRDPENPMRLEGGVWVRPEFDFQRLEMTPLFEFCGGIRASWVYRFMLNGRAREMGATYRSCYASVLAGSLLGRSHKLPPRRHDAQEELRTQTCLEETSTLDGCLQGNGAPRVSNEVRSKTCRSDL